MKFKEGDKVIAKNNLNTDVNRDDKGIIRNIDSTNSDVYLVTWNNYDFQWTSGSDLKLDKNKKGIDVNISININDKNKLDYQMLVRDKIVDLGGFKLSTNDNDDNVLLSSINLNWGERFIVMGFIQILLKDLVSIGCSSQINKSMYIRVKRGYTWKDAYNKIKDINSINYNVN